MTKTRCIDLNEGCTYVFSNFINSQPILSSPYTSEAPSGFGVDIDSVEFVKLFQYIGTNPLKNYDTFDRISETDELNILH
jgi:hypothetical protein